MVLNYQKINILKRRDNQKHHRLSLFYRRRLGSAEGVVQVYKCWSVETPIGDNSFSLMGETASPSEISPATVWGQRDYLRLLHFLEVNSAMVNFRGHVFLRSMVKSRHVGRPDGPVTYWRCLDLLPMHNFGLVRPVDTHGTSQFLIIGGDVNSTTPGTTMDSGDWKTKYDKLDAKFKQMKDELDSVKVTLVGVNGALTNSQSENQKLVSEIGDLKSANKQTQSTMKDVEVERDSLKVSLALADKELSACQIEKKRLVSEMKVIEVERDSAKARLDACQTEKKKLEEEIENLKSANKNLDGERQKAGKEAGKLKVEVSELRVQVSNSVTQSVLNDRLQKEKDLAALFVAVQCLDLWIATNNGGRTLDDLFGNAPVDLSDFRKVGTVSRINTWNVYRNENKVTVICDGEPFRSSGVRLLYHRKLNWENRNSGRLHATVETDASRYKVL